MSGGYPDGRYVFRRMYWRSLSWGCHGRARRRTRIDGRPTGRAGGGSRWDVYRAPSLGRIDFDRISDAENLLATWELLRREGGPASGVDGLRHVDLSVPEAGGILRTVSRAIRAGRYRPYPTRTVRILKPDGRRHRELSLPTIIDRIVAKAVAEALTGAVDGVFGDHVMGYRPKRSVWTMIGAIAQRIRDHGESWIVQGDIRDCFPTTPLDSVIGAFAQYIQDERVLDLIGRILRADDRHRIGLGQGNALSPLALNVFLHHLLDRPETAAEHRPPPLRYADNLVATAGSASNGLAAMRPIQQRLRGAGMDLAMEGPPVNLRREGAQIEIMGATLSTKGGRIRVQPGPTAWRDLTRKLEEAHLARNPARKAIEAAQGWLAAQAQAIESEERGEILSRVRHEAARMGFRELALPGGEPNREGHSQGFATVEQRLTGPTSENPIQSTSAIG